MEEIANKLVRNPLGIFAADESGGSIEKRFAEHNIEFSEENRRKYRQLFFKTPHIEQFISGVILFDETARQKTDEGVAFTEYLNNLGVISGIKVDKGLVPIPNFDGETTTAGLDGLQERLQEYYSMGLRFAKWRSALYIQNSKMPSEAAIAANVHVLARYASECQKAGIVPIVEPEIVHDGDFSLEECKQATKSVLEALFSELELFKVNRKALLLKTGMVLAGKKREETKPEDVAKATVETLLETVPYDTAGIVFLSGGQSVIQATNNLRAITDLGKQPWPITFSYARALQQPAIIAWDGKDSNVHSAQVAFFERIKANSEATIHNI